MKMKKTILLLTIMTLILSNLACEWSLATVTPSSHSTIDISSPTATSDFHPTPSATLVPEKAVNQSPEKSNEPVYISGTIQYSSPFFLNFAGEPFVLLEDQAGFVKRNTEFEFQLKSQIIGPVEFIEKGELKYYLSLPSEPQGTFVDLDHDLIKNQGVQIFAVAFWSNTWGDPFLEERDGLGWSSAYASTITDPENGYEIIGGTLVVWAPDDNQVFSSGFGNDGLLFTEDDPTSNIPAGYSFVDLNGEHFRIFKKDKMTIDLVEGDSSIKDFSNLSYGEAFRSLILRISKEYPFTQEKGIDWEELSRKYLPQATRSKNDNEYYLVIQDFVRNFPDGHVNLSTDYSVFFESYGYGVGLLLAELSDGKIIASQVFPDLPAEKAGIKPGAEIITWDGKPVSEAIEEVIPGFGPSSSTHTKRIEQVDFLTRVGPNNKISMSFINPGDSEIQETIILSRSETESLLNLLSSYNLDPLRTPIEGNILNDSGLGYIKVNTFNDDYQFMARLWEHYIDNSQESGIPGLIIDLRNNSGGSLGLAMDFAGFFFDEEIKFYRKSYYSEKTGEFEYETPIMIQPAPEQYDGKIAVLIGPDCVSACEGFAYALSLGDRSILIGHYPTAGAFGEVGRGQYRLPGEISLQFPTGRPETMDGKLLIEGSGVSPDILVPVTIESALGEVDSVLETAIQELLEMIEDF